MRRLHPQDEPYEMPNMQTQKQTTTTTDVPLEDSIMNWDIVGLVTLVIILGIFSIKNRKHFEIQGRWPWYFILKYNSQWGIKFITKLADKSSSWIKKLYWPIIITGIAAMGVMVGMLIYSAKIALTTPIKQTMGLVLPVQVAGTFYVPFMYWIICLAVILTVHEGAHAILCATSKIRIKHTGLALAGLMAIPFLPAAFVEPDEKQLQKAPHKTQNAILAAGPVANIILGLLCLAIMIGGTALTTGTSLDKTNLGAEITAVTGNAQAQGITPGETITKFRTSNTAYTITSPGDLQSAIIQTQANNQEEGALITDKGTYQMDITQKLGVAVKTKTLPPTNPLGTPIQWLLGLFNWLFILNLGIGLFNLLPLGPLDGGRIFQNLSHKIIGEKRGNKLTATITIILITLIIALFVYGLG